MCKGVPGHGYDFPPGVDLEDIRSVNVTFTILGGKGILLLAQVLESVFDLIPGFFQDFLGSLKVIYQPLHLII